MEISLKEDQMEASITSYITQINIKQTNARTQMPSTLSQSKSFDSVFGGPSSDIKECHSGFITEKNHSLRLSLSVAHNTHIFGISVKELSNSGIKRSLSMIDMVTLDVNKKGGLKYCDIMTNSIPIEYLTKIIKEGIRRKSRQLIETALSLATDDNMRKLCREFCKKKPQTCLASHAIVENIKQRVLLKFENKLDVLKIWVGRHVKISSGIDTIVLVTKRPKPSHLIESFLGLYLKVRCASECSSEAQHLLVHDMNDFTCSTGIQIKDIDINALLDTHSNITLINSSNVCSIGYGSHSHTIKWVPSIVIYCHIKGVIPIGEKAFPKKIGSYRVDVREAVCDFATNQVQMSQQIRNEDMSTSGTLGGFVSLKDEEPHAFLTCAHVVLPVGELKTGRASKYSLKREINVLDKNGDQIGKVDKAEFRYGRLNEVSVDAALIEITDQDRLPSNGQFADVYTPEQLIEAGFSERNIPQFPRGETEKVKMLNFRKPVLKIGAKTGVTIGTLKFGKCCANVMNYDIHVENMSETITLCRQMEVIPHYDPSKPSDSWSPFLDSGDSGSFVFFISQENPLVLKCIGLAVAKTSYGSCLMTPIEKVFEALHLPYNCLSKFTSKVAQEEINPNILSIVKDISRKMATKDDIQKVQEEIYKINERLSATESEVKILITEKTKDKS